MLREAAKQFRALDHAEGHGEMCDAHARELDAVLDACENSEGRV